MLNEREIYVLGKAAVDEMQDDYCRGVGSDIISKNPDWFIAYLDSMIAKLERVKSFTIDYQKAREDEEKDEPEW